MACLVGAPVSGAWFANTTPGRSQIIGYMYLASLKDQANHRSNPNICRIFLQLASFDLNVFSYIIDFKEHISTGTISASSGYRFSF
jgi:hypothetical protein